MNENQDTAYADLQTPDTMMELPSINTAATISSPDKTKSTGRSKNRVLNESNNSDS